VHQRLAVAIIITIALLGIGAALAQQPAPQQLPTSYRIDSASTTPPAGWQADTGFVGGNVTDRGSIGIANTNDPAIYRSERWGLTGYALPIANGVYTVRLHFAETNTGIDAGERVFGMSVESVALGSIDVFAEAGGRNIALVRAVNVEVTDGQLDIAFTAITQNPMISAIEVASTRAAPLRIEVGSSASFLDSTGQTWVADTMFTGGNTVTRPTVPISGTLEDRVYQSERWGGTLYTVPLAVGLYGVCLHFAETNPNLTQPGQRVFNVGSGHGESITLDLVALVGHATAYVWCYPFAADGDRDAALTLSLFGGAAENPTLAGIVITPADEPEEPTATSTATATATASATAGSSPTATGTPDPSALPSSTATASATTPASPTPTATTTSGNAPDCEGALTPRGCAFVPVVIAQEQPTVTPTASATATLAATVTPTATPTTTTPPLPMPTLTRTPTRTPRPEPPDFDNNGDGRVTCDDFDTQSEARAALRAGYTNLDRDGDGVPCETLPP
jgi:hypothetical protein